MEETAKCLHEINVSSGYCVPLKKSEEVLNNPEISTSLCSTLGGETHHHSQSLRGILKRPVSAGRGRYFSESHIDDFSWTSRQKLGFVPEEDGFGLEEPGLVSEEHDVQKKCVHFSDIVKRQVYRRNSSLSVPAQTAKNKKKAEKKRRAAERRKSEGDERDEFSMISREYRDDSEKSHDDSGLSLSPLLTDDSLLESSTSADDSSLSSSLVTESGDEFESSLETDDEKIRNITMRQANATKASNIVEPIAEHEVGDGLKDPSVKHDDFLRDSSHDDSGLASSFEENVIIKKLSKRQRKKKKGKTKNTDSETGLFNIDV